MLTDTIEITLNRKEARTLYLLLISASRDEDWDTHDEADMWFSADKELSKQELRDLAERIWSGA